MPVERTYKFFLPYRISDRFAQMINIDMLPFLGYNGTQIINQFQRSSDETSFEVFISDDTVNDVVSTADGIREYLQEEGVLYEQL